MSPSAKSEYLKCEGIHRHLLSIIQQAARNRTNAGWMRQHLVGIGRLTPADVERARAKRTKKSKAAALSGLVASFRSNLERMHINRDECSPKAVEELLSELTASNWVEWAQTDRGWVLQITDCGNQALGADPPTPTISTPDEAMMVILRILHRAKHDSVLHGDPRVQDGWVSPRCLPEWTYHHGVEVRLYPDALEEIVVWGWATRAPDLYRDFDGGFCAGFCRITRRGEAYLHGELMTDGQKGLWDALCRNAMTGKELAGRDVLDTTEDTVRQWVGELRKAGYAVENRAGRGYFRPDAPPDDFARRDEPPDSQESSKKPM